jgi:pilus assembly protein CpaF
MPTDPNPLAPLEPILKDPGVTEIMIDGYKTVYIEKGGQLIDIVPSPFRDEEQLMETINWIANSLGRRADESHPLVDLRLPDGSRVNVVVPPIALNGACMTIRKFYKEPITLEKLQSSGTFDEAIMKFLQACVEGRANLAVVGGTGAGKTVFLNFLANWIGADERIITCEDVGELRLPHRRHVALETRPANLEGRGEVTMTDLVINALKMRPERIIVGEVRWDEALHLLAAMNTGHDGSMFTMHATNPQDALTRLETMAGSANPSIPLLALREQIASALNFIVVMERLRDGTRKIVRVSEVEGLEGGVIKLADIFVYQQTGFENGVVQGKHVPTGKIPSFMKQLRERGVNLPMELFVPKMG